MRLATIISMPQLAGECFRKVNILPCGGGGLPMAAKTSSAVYLLCQDKNDFCVLEVCGNLGSVK